MIRQRTRQHMDPLIRAARPVAAAAAAVATTFALAIPASAQQLYSALNVSGRTNVAAFQADRLTARSRVGSRLYNVQWEVGVPGGFVTLPSSGTTLEFRAPEGTYRIRVFASSVNGGPQNQEGNITVKVL